MKRSLISIVLAILILCMAFVLLTGCKGKSYDSANWGAGVDWGPNHYWDSNDHTVKKKSSCVAQGTLITMADGTQKPIEQLKDTDLILAFDHMIGKYVNVNPIAVFNHGYELYPTVDLSFSDGSKLRIITGHVLFDLDLKKYVEITPNSFNDYIGHHFVKYSGKNKIDSTVLTSAKSYEAYNEAWGTWGFSSLACITNGILSLPNADGTYNYFEYDGNLKYDKEAMAADIEKFGIYTYEEWSELIPNYIYEAFNFKYFKVAIGKGLATYDTYLEHIDLFKELSGK